MGKAWPGEGFHVPYRGLSGEQTLVVLTTEDIKKHDQIQNGQLLGKYVFAGVRIGHCSKLWHHNPVGLDVGIVGITSQVFAPVIDFT